VNRKKRRLKYIRAKNFYRRGGVAKVHFKISEKLGVKALAQNLSECEDNLTKKFKLPFELIGFESNFVGDDFVKNLITVVAHYKKKI